MLFHLRSVPRWVTFLLVLWACTLAAHAVLLRQLADRTHAAAMLTAPTDATLVAGVLLVAVRILLYVVLPMASFARGAFWVGQRLSGGSANERVDAKSSGILEESTKSTLSPGSSSRGSRGRSCA